MTFYSLDPRTEECPNCDGKGGWETTREFLNCPECEGSGKCAEIEVRDFGSRPGKSMCGWRWIPVGKEASTLPGAIPPWNGNGLRGYPNEKDALFAARCAWAGVDVYQVAGFARGIDVEWAWKPSDDPDEKASTGYPNRNAALAAALDAKR